MSVPIAVGWRASRFRSATAAQGATKRSWLEILPCPRTPPTGRAISSPSAANGGCRNGSGEFRNFLSDIASHGYLVVAIGPAGDAVVGGSEGRTGQTQASQLLDGVDWAVKENSRQGSEYYRKIDISKVAVMGQSYGTGQALEVSGDPRVTTTVLLNGGPRMGQPRAAAKTPAAPMAMPLLRRPATCSRHSTRWRGAMRRTRLPCR
jgi:pimeloyl-ACP methyl ester carboxylesterase